MIYSRLNQVVANLLMLGGGTTDTTYLIMNFVIQIMLILVNFTAMYIFTSIACVNMAKKQNLKEVSYAWIPFVNLVTLGKLIGQTNLFGLKLKNIGFIACIVGLIQIVLGFSLDLLQLIPLFNNINNGTITIINENTMQLNSIFNTVLYVLYIGSNYIYILLKLILFINIFRLYAPDKFMMFTIFSIFAEMFLSLSFIYGLLLFLIRNNNKVDFNEYLKKRYSNPYGGGYNNNQSNNNSNSQTNAEPFGEFGENNKTNNTQNGNDDLFSDFK